MILIGLQTFFSCELIRILKYSVVLELYGKNYVKMVKIRLRKKSYNFGTNEENSLKICYENFKASSYVMFEV